jgi:hypothetical protein
MSDPFFPGVMVGGPDCGKRVNICRDVCVVQVGSSSGFYLRTNEIAECGSFVWRWEFAKKGGLK